MATETEAEFSLVRGDRLFRLQRAVGLIPPDGLGIGRRALFWAVVTWLPTALWAAAMGRAFPGAVAEPLLQHFAVHVVCLVAIPLLIVAEGVAQGVGMRLIPHFVRSGLVAGAARERFVTIVRDVVSLRDSWYPWVVVVGIVAAWTIASPAAWETHEVVWAVEGPSVAPSLGFGGWWFRYVVRPVYVVLLLAWVWRLALLTILLWRVARLDLSLVPTHADRAAGLGFLEGVPTAFAPVAFALSAVIAARWGHETLYHGVHLASFKLPLVALVVVLAFALLLPLMVFAPVLAGAKRRALLEYGALVGEHGRLVRRRWILREPLREAEVLDAPEIGPVADTISLYEAVTRMRAAPVGRRSLVPIALAIAVPMLPVVAIEIPIKDALLKLLQAVL